MTATEGKEKHTIMNNKPYDTEKHRWKRSYTLVLLTNLVYMMVFYVLMLIFS